MLSPFHHIVEFSRGVTETGKRVRNLWYRVTLIQTRKTNTLYAKFIINKEVNQTGWLRTGVVYCDMWLMSHFPQTTSWYVNKIKWKQSGLLLCKQQWEWREPNMARGDNSIEEKLNNGNDSCYHWIATHNSGNMWTLKNK